MNDLQKRFLLFLVGCIGTRLGLVYLAKTGTNAVLRVMGWLAIVPCIGFLYLFFTHQRLTGPEVFGGRIWWTQLRLVHGILYGLFAVSVLCLNSSIRHRAWVLLFIDVLIGLVSFLWHHYPNLKQVLSF